jgi:hypothetical protein
MNMSLIDVFGVTKMIPKSSKESAKKLLWECSPRLFHKAVPYTGQVFSIGIFSGKSPFHLSVANSLNNPILTFESINDEPAAFVADPFLCKEENRWHVFFEILSKIDRKGVIGLASSDDLITWSYECKVLKEPFHLAYPYVFKFNDKYYMIPDSPGNGVRLYESIHFPTKWKFVTTIIDDSGCVDSSIFRFKDMWWLFTASSPTPGEPKSLYLFFSESLLGRWQEHPLSPVVAANDSTARPAGRVKIIDGALIRFAQDGIPCYGTCVWGFEITKLSTDSYEEKQIGTDPVLCAGNSYWNSEGMHHIDPHLLPDGSWIACVDGWYSGS